MLNLDVNVKVADKDLSVKELLEVDQADLPNEFAAQAARYAYFATMTSSAELAWLDCVRQRKESEASAYMFYKNDKESIPDGSRSVSDGTAAKLVDIDEEVSVAREEEDVALHKFHTLRDLSRAFEQRASMLQSMGAQLRHEYDMTDMESGRRG